MNYKRVLVISNNCFSLSNSNGRTLGNLFHQWPKNKLAQFCVIATDPNWDLCDNYYCLEDRTVLKSFFQLKKATGRLLKPQRNTTNVHLNQVDTNRPKTVEKTALKIILREMVWAKKRWKSKSFLNWVDDFNPELLVLQAGDTAFMIEIAIYLSNTLHIPLVVYNTEGFYFFKKNCYQPGFMDVLSYPVYKSNLENKYQKLMNVASHSIYLNYKLKRDYDDMFHKPSTVIYNSSSLKASTNTVFSTLTPSFSYLGNLGLYRDLSLVEVGEVLQRIDPNYYLDVYGNADSDVSKRLMNAKGIRFHGRVSYQKVTEVIQKSDILFHVESEIGNEQYQIQYGFSGKIADSICSGKCFVLYAPQEVACSQYIQQTNAGWYAGNKEELYAVLIEIIENEQKRKNVLEQAKKIAVQNHNYETNAKQFQEILCSAKLSY